MNAPHDTGPCFYCPDLPGEGEKHRLAEEETHHASASRRIRVGDTIGLIDGRGTRATAVVETVARRSLSFTVRSRRSVPPAAPSLVVASAVPKGERFRTMIDMLSQIGVAVIMTLNCERSAVKPRKAAGDRWRRIAIEACKQSRNPFVPEVAGPLTVHDSLQRVAPGDTILYAEAGGRPLHRPPAARGSLYLYVGPEGGFTDGEKKLLEERGARPVAFGENILRVETAAVAGAVLALQAPGGSDR